MGPVVIMTLMIAMMMWVCEAEDQIPWRGIRNSFQQLNTAESHATAMMMMMMNRNERAAWRDCLELYEETTYQLNNSLEIKDDADDDDDYEQVRTWLSAGLTNLQTCETGFNELGVSPLPDVVVKINGNVSELISNALLALGRWSHSGGRGGGDYREDSSFPSWVSKEERKLLLQEDKTDLLNEVVIVVAQDGSGDYKSIKKALKAASEMRKSSNSSNIGRIVIKIKTGVYKEYLEVDRTLNNLTLVGDGKRKTIITGHRSVATGYTTFRSATVAVRGTGFIARGITFRNTAGPNSYQAVSLRSNSDRSIFYNCGFEGYQDTLYAHSQRQFYRQSDIYGTVDFIFGNAAAVFQACHLYVRKPMPQQANTATAQGRTDPFQNTGFVIHRCKITAAPEDSRALREDGGVVKTFMGRPWKKYSRTVVMRTQIDSVVDPKGWLEWDGDDHNTTDDFQTLYYAEYENYGDGSRTDERVDWPGHQIITDKHQAANFTVRSFIQGESWITGADVPFLGGM